MNRRSDCPISVALDLFGDRWTLLVVRDLALRGKRSFSELLNSDEGIATNILSDRLSRLEDEGLVTKTADPEDGRRFLYRLTETGKGLLAVLVEVIVWSAHRDPTTAASESFVRAAKKDRNALMRRLHSQFDR
jgi:DNA-binding HxlR family transcriptional regulator